MKTALRRSERRRDVHVVLGQRDEALLRSLARFRIAYTTDLLALFFSRVRRDTAMARLRRLLDAGYIDVRVRGVSEENIYSLGPAGRVFADRHGLAHDPPPRGNPEHHFAVVRVWCRLAAALHGHPNFRLLAFVPDWQLRRRLTGTAPPVVPDAWVEVQQSSGSSQTTHAFSVEIDLGSERPGELKRKLMAYSLTDGVHDGRGLVVVLVGAGAVRRRVVSAILAAQWPGWGLVCGMEVWPAALLRRFGDADQAPMTESHGGQGTAAPPSPSPANQSAPSGEQHSRHVDQGDRSER